MSYAQKAVHRLSGGKIPNKNRITLDIKDFLNYAEFAEKKKD